MKKLFVFLIALTVVGTTVFAQDAKKASPEATYGFSGSFEMDLVRGAKSDTFAGSYLASDAVAKDNPQGFRVTEFRVNPWLNLDWSRVSFRGEATYNAFKSDQDDFSRVRLITTLKDFYGFQIRSEVTADNRRTGDAEDGIVHTLSDVESSPDVTLGAPDHNIFITYTTPDKANTFVARYTITSGDANDVQGTRTGNILNPVDFVADFIDGYRELGWTLDTPGIGARLQLVNNVFSRVVTKNVAGDWVNETAFVPTAFGGLTTDAGRVTLRNRIGDAWIEGRNMFGMWTSRVNAGAMKFRQGNLDLDISEDRDDVSNEFEVDREVSVFAMFKTNDAGAFISPVVTPFHPDGAITDADRGVNWLNTVKINDALSARVGMVVPYAAVAFVDWLKGENLLVGVDYTLKGVGRFSAGSLVSMDYDTLLNDLNYGLTGLNIEGKSKALAEFITLSGDPIWGPGFWLDATVTEAVPGLRLFASVDARFGSYLDRQKINSDVAAGRGNAPNNLLTITTAPLSMFNLGLEAAYKVIDPLTVSAALYTGISTGLEFDTATGMPFVGPAVMSGSWSEADWARARSEVKPLIVKVRGDYRVNDTVSVWASNAFTANAHYFENNALDGDVTFAGGAAVEPVFGFFNKNTIGLGTSLTASKNASLKIGAELNIYTAPSLEFVATATADQRNLAEKNYDLFKATNLDPFKITVAFSYTF